MEAVLSKAYDMQLPAGDTCDIYDGQGITYASHLHLDGMVHSTIIMFSLFLHPQH